MNTENCFDEEMLLEVAIWVCSLYLMSKNKKCKINKQKKKIKPLAMDRLHVR